MSPMLTIESIEKQCGAVVLYRIALSDGSSRLVHSGTVRRLKLKPGPVPAPETLEGAIAASEETEARESALRSLSARGRTAAELRGLLQGKGFGAPVLDHTLTWLAEKGLLEEGQLLEDTAEALLQRKGLRHARQVMLRRGFTKEETERVLKAKAGEREHFEGALTQARRRQEDLQRRYPKDWAPRLGAWLYSRGYEGDLVRQVLKALKAPGEEFDAE